MSIGASRRLAFGPSEAYLYRRTRVASPYALFSEFRKKFLQPSALALAAPSAVARVAEEPLQLQASTVEVEAGVELGLLFGDQEASHGVQGLVADVVFHAFAIDQRCGWTDP